MNGRLEFLHARPTSFTLKRDQGHAVTLTIDLPDDQEAALQAKANAQGVSAEQYARQVLEQDLQSGGPARRHISEVIRDRMRKVPPEMMAAMPEDGASQHDHYIYGLPKREQ